MSRAIARDGKVWYEPARDEKPIAVSVGLVQVFLNGEEQMHTMAADEERGWVANAINDNPGGKVPGYIIDPFSEFGVKTERKIGKVEIRLSPEALEAISSLKR